MADPLPPDYGATQALRRVSPQWAWIRANVTPSVVLSFAGMLVTVVGGGMALTHQLGQMQEQLAHLTETVKASQAHDTEFAKMQQRVQDLSEEVADQRARWNRVDQTLDTETRRRRR